MSNYQVKDNHIAAEYDINGNVITQDEVNERVKSDIKWLKENGTALSPEQVTNLAKVPVLASQLDEIDIEVKNFNSKSTSDLYIISQENYVFNDPVKVTTSLDKPILKYTDTSLIVNKTTVEAYNYGTNIVNEPFLYTEIEKISQANPNYPYRTFVSNKGMTGSNLVPALNAEFMYDGNELEFILSSYETVTIWFDEGRGYERMTKYAVPITIQGKSILYLNCKFKNEKLRRFKINSKMRFGGVNFQNGKSLTTINQNDVKDKICFVGDSLVEGATIPDKTLAYPQLVADALGYNCINNGIGATGYLADGSNHERVKIFDRLDNDVISFSPKIVVFAAGINDLAFETGLVVSQLQNCVNKIKTGLPNSTIIIFSPFSPRNAWSNLVNLNNAFKDFIISNKLNYIDTIEGKTYKGGVLISSGFGAWIFGSNINTFDGNCHLYIDKDTTHLNKEGHYYFSKLAKSEIYKLLN